MKKIISAALAAAVAAGMAGCTLTTPQTVGTIGDTTVTGGMYLLFQYDAYNSAASLSEEDFDDVKAVLKSTVTTEDGSTMTGSEYVAAETLRSLEYYAAVEERFAQLGGELSEEEQASVDSYTDSMWSYYEDTYTANGIGKETLRAQVANSYKSGDLLELVYGTEGEQPVSDEELTDYLNEECVAGYYMVMPITSESTYMPVDEETQEMVMQIAQDAVDVVNEGGTLEEAATNHLPMAFEAVGNTYSEDMLYSYVGNTVFYPSDLEQYTDSEGNNEVRDAFLALEDGEAGAVNTGTEILVLQRADPLEVSTLDEERSLILNAMKSEELTDSLYELGAQLEHALDADAMNTYAASNIKA